MKGRIRGSGHRCCNSRTGQKKSLEQCSNHGRHSYRLGSATRGTKQQPTGLLLTLLRRVVLFDSRTGQKNPSSIAATTVDIPIGWHPNTKKEPTGLFFTACGRPCSFDSSYGLHEKIPDLKIRDFIHDPYGNRTHVTAVKGPCLNRLTNGPYKYRASLKPPTFIVHYCGRPSPLS